MKLLILTQKVDINDDLLGFFHGWLKEFAKHCDKITVICLKKGDYELPGNVKVLSLGKEMEKSRIKYLINFYKYIWQERKNYDNVFVHMNPEYVVLGGWLWMLWRKKIYLWFVHKSVNLKLRIAEKLVTKVFTASKDSFKISSEKVEIIGHGVDIKKFRKEKREDKDNTKFNVLYVGRISRIKNQELLINAIDILVNRKGITGLNVKLIGTTFYQDDEKYLTKLKGLVKEKKLSGYIEFIGRVPNREIVKYYNDADLSVNLCPTGGVDKAVLESMACELPVIVLNKSFIDVLPGKKFILNKEDKNELADKIFDVINLTISEKEELGRRLRNIVIEKYNQEKLIKNIIDGIR